MPKPAPSSLVFAALLAVLLTASPAFAVSYTLLNGVTTTGAGTAIQTGVAKGVGCVAYSTAGSSATVTFEQSFDNAVFWTAATASNPTATGEPFVLPPMPYTRANATARASGTLWAKCATLNAEVSQVGPAVPTATATAAKMSVIKATWTNAELVAASTGTYNKPLGSLPANSIVKNVLAVVDGQATFAAGTLTIAVGGTSGGGYVDLLKASDIKAAAATVYGDVASELATANTGVMYYPTATPLVAQFLTGAGTTATVTGSSGTIYVVYETLP